MTGTSHAQDVLRRLLDTVDNGRQPRQWRSAAPYLLRYAVRHAARAGRIDDLLSDPEFLVYADPATLVPELDSANDARARLNADIYRTSLGLHRHLEPSARRALLAIDAARHSADTVVEQLTDGAWAELLRPRWATGSQIESALRDVLATPAGRVSAVTCSKIGDLSVVVTGGADGMLRIWDLSSGNQLRQPLATGDTKVTTAASCEVQGRPAVVAGGPDGTLHIWDLSTGRHLRTLASHDGAIHSLACTMLHGRPIAVSGGDARVHIWDLESGHPLGMLNGHLDRVSALACTELQGRPVVLSGSGGGQIKLWDLEQQRLIKELNGPLSRVTALACNTSAGRTTAVVGTFGGHLWIWDLPDGQPRGPQTELARRVNGAACTTMQGHPVAVVTTSDGLIHTLDLATADMRRSPLRHQHAEMSTVTCTLADGQPIAVTGGVHGMAYIWRLEPRPAAHAARQGHWSPISTIACTVLDERPVAITGSQDGRVRLWDVGSGDEIGLERNYTGRHHGAFGNLDPSWQEVTCTILAGRPAILARDQRGGARMWDPVSGQPLGSPLIVPSGQAGPVGCAEIEGRPVAVTGGQSDRSLRVWDVQSGQQIYELAHAHTHGVSAIMCLTLAERTVVVSAGRYDRGIQIWDLTTGELMSGKPSPYIGSVAAMAPATLEGHPVIVTSDALGTVQLWNPRSGMAHGDPIGEQTGTGVTTIACGAWNGRPIAAVGDREGRLRIWDLLERLCLETLTMPGPIGALAVSGDGSLVVGASNELVVLEPTVSGAAT